MMTLCIRRKGNYLPCSKNKTELPPGNWFLTCCCMFINFPSHSCWSAGAGTGMVVTVEACLLLVLMYPSKSAPCN